MFRIILFAGLLFAAFLVSDRNLSACGDKFLVLGRSVGYQSLLKASKPGSVLLYKTAALPAPITDGRFKLVMDAAGHQLSTVSDRAALDHALANGKIDLVLADPATSRLIGGIVNTTSTAMVVPILSDSGAAERATFVKEFGCILRLPADTRAVIDALDKAMKLRAKRVVAHSA
jgi:hypothetical protein